MAYEGPKGPPTPEYKIAKIQNFAPSDKTWKEDFEMPGDNEVLRLANVLDRIRFYAKYEPEY